MLMLALLMAAGSPGDGKTMASDDWQQLAIYGVGGGAAGPLYLQVHAGDLDGDGSPDDAVVKLQCDGDQLREAHVLVSPRDSASGMPTGKRQHSPITFVKEWSAASPQLMAAKPTYDVKTMKGNERMSGDGWTQVSLGNTGGLCAAAGGAVKSRSNIQNN